MTRTTSVTLGDQTLEVEYFVNGGYAAATEIDPAECPEIEFWKLRTPGGEDVSGLMAHQVIYEQVMEQIEEQMQEDRYAGPDPDDARDRAQDARMEDYA